MLVLQPQIGGSRVHDAVRAGGRQSVGAGRTGAARRWQEREREELLESDAVYVLGRVCLFCSGIAKPQERGEGDDGGEETRLGESDRRRPCSFKFNQWRGSPGGEAPTRQESESDSDSDSDSDRELEGKRREEREEGPQINPPHDAFPHTLYHTHTHTDSQPQTIYAGLGTSPGLPDWCARCDFKAKSRSGWPAAWVLLCACAANGDGTVDGDRAARNGGLGRWLVLMTRAQRHFSQFSAWSARSGRRWDAAPSRYAFGFGSGGCGAVWLALTSILRLAGSRRGPSAASSECAPQRRFIALSLIGNQQMSTRFLHFALPRFLVSRFLSKKGLAVAYDAGRCSSYGTDRAGRRAGGNPGGWFSALRVCPKLDPAELWL